MSKEKNKSGDLPLSHKDETFTQLAEWFPELLLLVTDVVILGVYDHADKIAGASVAAIMLGAVARLVRSLTSVSTKLAQADSANRRELLSLNYIFGGIGVVLALMLLLLSAYIEKWVGLPGISDYLLFAAPASMLMRVSGVSYIALGVFQKKVKARIIMAWCLCLSNIALTLWLVPKMGVSGASLGMLLADVIPAVFVIYWAHSSRCLTTPKWRLAPFVWKNAKRKLLSDIPGLVNSGVAVVLNRWLGPEQALVWTLSHVSCDFVGLIALSVWDVASKHFTYNINDRTLGESCWAWGDRLAMSITGIGVCVSGFVTPMAPMLVLSYCLSKRWSYEAQKYATTIGFNRDANGKLARCTCCIVGYMILVSHVAPSVWGATAVYCCSCVAQWFAMRETYELKR